MSVEDDLRAMARRGPAGRAAQGRGQHLEGAERQRRHEPRHAASSSACSTPTTTRSPARSSGPGAGCPTAYDVVQGHCVIRNGDASLVARTVAVEFESIYAVSHPGRAALHGFGLFGGSNGYWRTRPAGPRPGCTASMLTEDIDSTLRVLAAGAKIASDPALVSCELAPTTAGALWKQRARWAQGWFQVSRKHLRLTLALAAPDPAAEGRPGLPARLARDLPVAVAADLPGARLHRLPRRRRRPAAAGWRPRCCWPRCSRSPSGPAQTLFAWRLAVPEIRRAHGRWFWSYLLVSSLVYTEWKNIIARDRPGQGAASGEHQWNVTPRTDRGPERGERMSVHTDTDTRAAVTPDADPQPGRRRPAPGPPEGAPRRARARELEGYRGLAAPGHRRLPRAASTPCRRHHDQPGGLAADPVRDRRRAVRDVGVPADAVVRPRGDRRRRPAAGRAVPVPAGGPHPAALLGRRGHGVGGAQPGAARRLGGPGRAPHLHPDLRPAADLLHARPDLVDEPGDDLLRPAGASSAPLAVRPAARLPSRRRRVDAAARPAAARCSPSPWSGTAVAFLALHVRFDNWPVYFGPQSRFGAFAVGMALAVIAAARRSEPLFRGVWPSVLRVAALGVVLGATALNRPGTLGPGGLPRHRRRRLVAAARQHGARGPGPDVVPLAVVAAADLARADQLQHVHVARADHDAARATSG